MIIGEFNKRTWLENTFSTYTLSVVTAFLIGVSSIFLNLFLIKTEILNFEILILIPIMSMLLALSLSMPISTFLNRFAFKHGFNPNNVVGPIMTAVDDFFTVICFYFTLILLGVP